MENNEIIEKLLQDNSSSKEPKNDEISIVKKSNKDNSTSVSTIRVVTAKYKVYIVLLLILICALWIEIIPNADSSYSTQKTSYNQAKSQLNNIKSQIKDAEKDEKVRKWIIENEEALKACLNDLDKDKCLSLTDWKVKVWDEEKYDFSIPLSYLQTNSLHSQKMPVDEKKVIKNLNEYLIKEDIDWNSKYRVWDIQKISIWTPETIKDTNEHFFKVPVSVSIEFQEIWNLTGFLYNVEKKMIENWDDRILYKIQSVSYDVVTNDEPQVTDIDMIAYYYYDEKFENTEDLNTEDNSTDETENWDGTKETEEEAKKWDNK